MCVFGKVSLSVLWWVFGEYWMCVFGKVSLYYGGYWVRVESEGQLGTKRYNKRNEFNSPIVNFPCICSNIPAVPTYRVSISQLTRYSKPCGLCHDILHFTFLPI
jgi:hypothetical protein